MKSSGMAPGLANAWPPVQNSQTSHSSLAGGGGAGVGEGGKLGATGID